jgi:hypothetical protein
MLPADLPHFLIAASLRSPQHERRGMQAVDAALDITDVVAFFRLGAQGNELQDRIVHRRKAPGAGNRKIRRFLVLEQHGTEHTTEVERKRFEHGFDGSAIFQALRQSEGLCAVTLVACVQSIRQPALVVNGDNDVIIYSVNSRSCSGTSRMHS